MFLGSDSPNPKAAGSMQRQRKNLRTLLTPIRFDLQRSIYPRFLCIFSLCIVALFVFVLFCYNLMHVHCFGLVVNTCVPPPSVWPHLFRGAGHEKRRGEQLKWSLACRLYIGSFPCAQLPGPVHTARLGRVYFFIYLSRFVFLCLYCFNIVCPHPFVFH